MADDEKKKTKKRGRNFLLSSLLAIPVILLTHCVSPGHIPYAASDVWSFHGTGFWDWMKLAVPFFAWGVGVTLLIRFWKRDELAQERVTDILQGKSRPSKSGVFFAGLLISTLAGLLEEVAFRWLIFLASFTYLAIGNFLFFGFLGFGIGEWLTVTIFAPLANFTTLGYLEPWLKNPNWLVAAAVLSANAFFRDGHKYLGPLGVVNSWFMGMFFFYVMFTHGLLAAIVVHFTYDLLIFSTAAALHRK